MTHFGYMELAYCIMIFHRPNALHIGVPTMQATTINTHSLDVSQQGLVMRAYMWQVIAERESTPSNEAHLPIMFLRRTLG